MGPPHLDDDVDLRRGPGLQQVDCVPPKLKGLFGNVLPPHCVPEKKSNSAFGIAYHYELSECTKEGIEFW
jgi:hypothetical protein